MLSSMVDSSVSVRVALGSPEVLAFFVGEEAISDESELEDSESDSEDEDEELSEEDSDKEKVDALIDSSSLSAVSLLEPADVVLGAEKGVTFPES